MFARREIPGGNINDRAPDVTLVKRGYDAFNAADTTALTELIAEDATQHMVGDNLVSGEFKGRDAILGMYGRVGEITNGTYRAEVEQIFTDGAGTVVVMHHQTAARNGQKLDNRQAMIFTIIDGTIVDLQVTTDDLAVDDAFLG